jgi:hypothetical protein
MRLHQALSLRPELFAAAEKLRVDKIERSNIQRGWDNDLTAPRDQALNKVKASLAMVEATINMGAFNVQKAFRTHQFGRSDQYPHGESGSFTALPVE